MAAAHFTTLDANLTQPIGDKESHVLQILLPELAKLCMLVLKILELFCTLFMNVV